MSDVPPEPATSNRAVSSPPGRGPLAFWLLCGVVGLAALTLACVHATERIKLIGLFSIALGLVSGWAKAGTILPQTTRPDKTAVYASVLSLFAC